MLRAILAASLLSLGATSQAQTAQPTGPTTGAAQADGAQPAGTVQRPELTRQRWLDQPANPQPYGGSLGGPIQETGKYDGLGLGAATSSAGDSNPRPLVQPDYRRSDPPGTPWSRP